MIVDTSVIVSILRAESDASYFSERLSAEADLSMSAGSWLELAAVIVRSGDHHLWGDATALLEAAGITIIPVSVEQARLGREAYRRFGRGSGHPAALNFGDCFAYALARSAGEPLLFKGADFVQTGFPAA